MSKITFFSDETLTTTREYALTEFFDPRVNKSYLGILNSLIHPNTIPSLMLKKILQTVITRQTYRDYFTYFNPGLPDYFGYSGKNDFFNQVISQVADEDLWALAFWSFRGMSQATIERSNLRVTAILPTRYEGDRIYHTEGESDECTVSTFLTKFMKIKTKWEVTFTTAARDNFRVAPPTNGNLFMNGIIQFCLGRMKYTTSTDGHITQASLANINDPSKIITNYNEETISAGNWPTFTLNRYATRENRSPLYAILNYSTQATNLIEWPIIEANEKNPTLYGVELECTFDYDIRKVIDAQATPFFIAKQDSSISGSKQNKAELVTVPMSLKAQKKHWAHWFKNVDYSRFDCTRNTTNGMHIHIDRKAFLDNTHLRNMVWFYNHPANTDFLVYISERGSVEKMSRYSRINTYDSIYTKVQSYKRCMEIANDKNCIVNLRKTPTIEVRMFRGIVSFGELVKNLEFVDAVLNFTGQEYNINRLTFSDFLVWLTRQPINKYTVLRKFIDQCRHLPEMMVKAEVKNITFNLTDPTKIAERLNKSKIQITNAHIQVLNRGQKRKYILDPATQSVVLTTRDLSKLAPIDRAIEARYTRHAI